MAEPLSQPNPAIDSDDDERAAAPSDAVSADSAPSQTSEAESPSWSNLWQAPAILLSLLLIGAGVYTAMLREEPPPLSILLDHAEALVEDEQLEPAAGYLESTVKPRLHDAGPADEARFHAIVADWIAATQAAQAVSLEKNNVLIDEQYARAAELGMMLSEQRLERWAMALIELGRLDAAQQRLDDLEARLASQTAAPEARDRRNRVFRRLVQAALERSDRTPEELLSVLESFRRDSLLGIEDEIWAVARQGELQIETAQPQRAIDLLMLEMRRLEPRVTDAHRAAMGELYVVLGRAYHRAGNDAYAQFNLERSLDYFSGPEIPNGWAHVMLGQIDADHGRFEEALEHFDNVVRGFGSSPCWQPAMLGRAEVLSILGEHDKAMDDYARLGEALIDFPRRRTVTIDRMRESVVDRHDAALAMGRLRVSLEYLQLLDPLFAGTDVPPDVLLRKASTARQIAANLLADARHHDATGEAIPLDAVDPAVRYEASRLFEQAGLWAVDHARLTRTDVDEQDQWAESLWIAADCYDQAGLHDRAVELFREYVGTRSDIDPRRPEAIYRLAQSYDALMQYEPAARRYEQVIDEHPRSVFATSSFVPLARVLQLLDRQPEAEQLLTQVVQGQHVVQPDAADYRDALIQLGALQYDAGQYVRAIEHLDAAVERYPDDVRRREVEFRLADAHRRYGLELEQQAKSDPTLSPDERQRLIAQREVAISKAQHHFETVVTAYDADDPMRLDALQRDFHRRAHLYRADCAYLLGDYHEAIALYDEAARRYSDQHSSLVALIQIVNCYYGLNDPQRARTAEQRARVRLKQLPDRAFTADDSLMDRAAWERWLANNPPGRSLVAADS